MYQCISATLFMRFEELKIGIKSDTVIVYLTDLNALETEVTEAFT